VAREELTIKTLLIHHRLILMINGIIQVMTRLCENNNRTNIHINKRSRVKTTLTAKKKNPIPNTITHHPNTINNMKEVIITNTRTIPTMAEVLTSKEVICRDMEIGEMITRVIIITITNTMGRKEEMVMFKTQTILEFLDLI
jgi:hypothetical protein